MTIRFLLLGAVSGAALLASPAYAACTGTGTITCTGSTIGDVEFNQDGSSVTVEAVASITATGGDDAVQIEADDLALTNRGTISTNPGGDDAIRLDGDRVSVFNAAGALIDGADRAITERTEGRNEDFTLVNDGAIIGRGGDAVEVNTAGFSVTNRGSIGSTDGRALQGRGFGFTVDNAGTVTATDEAIEGRDGFDLINRAGATITSSGGDGVQYGDGTLINYGTIDGGDDGVDTDSGLVRNFGTIIARGADGGGIDIDPEAEGGGIPGGQRIENHDGASITGFVGILADPIAQQPLQILNEGTITGTSGDAIVLAGSQQASLLELRGNSIVDGNVAFGGGDDELLLGDFLLAGDLASGGEIDGGEGTDLVRFLDYDFASLFNVAIGGGLLSLEFQSLSGELKSASLRNFELLEFNDGRYAIRDGGLAAVPVPAAGLLLGAGLFGFAALRRRG